MNSTALSINISGANDSNTASNAVDFDSKSLLSLIPAWAKYCAVAFIGIASLIGIPGNSLVSTILLKQVRKTTTDWFIIFIAIFDTLSLVVSGTISTLVITPGVWDVVRSTVLCRFHSYMSHFFFIQSLYLITAVGIDRYVKTCKPHSTFYTPKSAFRSSVVAIVISAACSIPFYFTTHLNQDGDCVIDRSKATLRLTIHSVVLLCVLASSVALITWYTKIALQIRKRVNFNPKAASMRRKEGTGAPSGHLTTKTELPNSALSCDSGKSEVSIEKAIKTLGCSQEQLNEIGKESVQVANEVRTTTDRKSKPTTAFGNKPSETRDHCEDDRKANAKDKVQKQTTRDAFSSKQKQASKTTKIMAYMTMVFIFSTSMPAIAISLITAFGGLKSSEVGRFAIFTMMRMYFINNFINPIFYITLSSVFRKRVAEVLNTCRR